MKEKVKNLSKDQAKFLDLALEGKNIFLTGKAGTGKTTVVRKFLDHLTQSNKLFLALAPTGIAATNVGGATIHSTFKLPPFGILKFESVKVIKNSEQREILSRAEVIIIDEVSMLRPDILDAMHWTLKRSALPGLETKQIIFIGDLKQLPPPISDQDTKILLSSYSGIEFYHASIYKRLNVKEVELEEILRQSNPEFISTLNIIRDGGKSDYFLQFKTTEPKGIVLAPHNATVATYNQKGLDSLSGKEHVFVAQFEGKASSKDFNLEEVLVLKEGAKIMYLVNHPGLGLFNGSLGTFHMQPFVPDGVPLPVFRTEEGRIVFIDKVSMEKMEYGVTENKKTGQKEVGLVVVGSMNQLPVKLAYALTIHKSQGLTFDEMTLDLTLPLFSKGQLYTALSRVRGPEGLHIISPRK